MAPDSTDREHNGRITLAVLNEKLDQALKSLEKLESRTESDREKVLRVVEKVEARADFNREQITRLDEQMKDLVKIKNSLLGYAIVAFLTLALAAYAIASSIAASSY